MTPLMPLGDAGEIGIVVPIFGLLILGIWFVGNLIENGIKALSRRHRESREQRRRGFEVKIAAPGNVLDAPGNDARKSE